MQPLPPETLIERKKQMRMIQEERRREKKQKQHNPINQDDIQEKIRRSAEMFAEQQLSLEEDELMAKKVDSEIAMAIQRAANMDLEANGLS